MTTPTLQNLKVRIYSAPHKFRWVPQGLDVLAKYMKECLSAKEDLLLKFLSRLDTGAPTVQLLGPWLVCVCVRERWSGCFFLPGHGFRECDKMQKVVTQLNQLYDDLANIQAEGKVTGMSPECPSCIRTDVLQVV